MIRNSYRFSITDSRVVIIFRRSKTRSESTLLVADLRRAAIFPGAPYLQMPAKGLYASARITDAAFSPSAGPEWKRQRQKSMGKRSASRL